MKILKRLAAFILLAAVICAVWYTLFTVRRLEETAEYRIAVTAVKERREHGETKQRV